MSCTNYQQKVSVKDIDTIKAMAKTVPVECLMEILADYYCGQEDPQLKSMDIWCMHAVMMVCEESPDYPHKKDFPAEDKTIGEMCEYLHQKDPNRSIGELVDYVLNKKMIQEILSKKH